MFVWLFHRVSGLALILLLGMQMVTGLLQMSKKSPAMADGARKLHSNGFCVTLVALLLIMHAMYGLRTILYDVGVRKEKVLFWATTVCGLVLTAVYLWFFLTLE